MFKRAYWYRKFEMLQILITVLAILAAVTKLEEESGKAHAEAAESKALAQSQVQAQERPLIVPQQTRPLQYRAPVVTPALAQVPKAQPKAISSNQRIRPSIKKKLKTQLASKLPKKKKVAEAAKFVGRPTKKIASRKLASVNSSLKAKRKKPISIQFNESDSLE